LRPRDHDYARLIAETKLLDELSVSIDFDALHVVQEPAALSHELEQPLASVVILLVSAEVFGQVVDSFREERDLDRGGTGVGLVSPMLLERWSFFESHELLWCPRGIAREGH
jgi:hypothetical protein